MAEQNTIARDAENKRLREIIATLRRENDALVMQVGAMAGGDVAKLRAELDRANARYNALRVQLVAAWREHGIEGLTDGERAVNAVTGAGALSRICPN